MNKLSNLEPSDVLHFFEEISQIPRTSGNEKEISDWLVDFAQKRNLEVYRDNALNVIIKKPGTKGYENSPAVIIQGHMDMVGEKSKTSTHDFLKDPIALRVEGDYIYATDTTLGGDDGIAIAFGLAILDSNDIPHPPIELLITTSEETGMNGAIDLDPTHINGKVLLNIDAEEEGVFLVSCAGGVNAVTSFNPSYENGHSDAYEIFIGGLKGGHSGMEIVKQRANAVKLLGRLLDKISSEYQIKLSSICGGAKHNAIAREASAVIVCKDLNLSVLSKITEEMADTFRNEYSKEDPDIIIDVKQTTAERNMTLKDTRMLIDYITVVPDGVQTVSREIQGLVVSSLNLGVLELKDGEIVFTHSIRSSVRSLRDEIAIRVQHIARLCGGSVKLLDSYPEWQYNPESKVRDIAVKTYKDLWGKEPAIEAIHAGLECGLLKEKLGELDMISFGPNLYDVHTPNEHMSISSVERTYKFLKALLANLK